MVEYRLMTQAMGVSWDDRTLHGHADELLRVFEEWLPRALASLAEEGGEPWEVVSHDLLPVDDGLLISLLLRRSPARTPR